MKKSVFKTITAIMLFSIAFSAVLFFSCKKNVGDAYNYDPTHYSSENPPVVLAPDFQVLTVDYTFSNEALNSESSLSFKVAYINNEVTETTYYSVLNFYVDGVILNSIPLENIKANTKLETVFNWKAVAGKHDIKFDINLSSTGSKVVEEANTTNNSQTKSLDIPAKQLAVVKVENVPVATVNQTITADPVANVASVLAAEKIVVSTTVPATSTTYANNTTAVVAAVTKSDGTTDSTKVVLSVTNNVGVTTGQAQQTTSTMIVQTLVAQKEVSFYNANEKFTYTNGVISYSKLKSYKNFSPCSEPSNLELVYMNAAANKAFNDRATAALNANVANGLANTPLYLIETEAAYGLTQGSVDNPPTYTVELLNPPNVCSTDCVNNVMVQKKSYPGFTLRFSDDRNPGVQLNGTGSVIASYTKAASCDTSNNGTYTFVDCGGNSVTYTFNAPQPVNTLAATCVSNVHN